MNVSILTLFPELYKPFLQTSLLKRAQEKKLINFSLHNMFDLVQPKQRIDAPTFGHSSGMLIRPDVIERAIEQADQEHGKSFKIFLSPQGRKLTQRSAQELWKKIASQQHVLLLASRYEGIDARVEQEYSDEIISVGDFVVMGGDIPAMLLLECLLRYMPGVVGKEESVALDSFSGAFVDHPEYTKPVEWKGRVVPEILRSGNHAAIAKWREEKSAELTVKKHFDWLRSYPLTHEQKELAAEYIPSHYVALMHTGIELKDGLIGTTSVTSIDVHDIARSSATYGIKNYFIVTSLTDQKMMTQNLLNFWQEKEVGGQYNKDRHNALNCVLMADGLDDVIATIEKKEGKKPLILGTSAKFTLQDPRMISYNDQAKVWSQDRPVLILLGTGHGMCQELLKNCDYVLQPIQGFSRFNHLSVRSAAAIIFDKWLGLMIQK
ncbi:MAG TPA: tRNA (guanosine(37)-N1)-methyltransferase TrmD [Candidatus Saccharimonadales bacterium]|nr:tRNA (guanosine(37)-N1)-methyltransferase TrmD [Candidatus Saccharimonadales bacterium]